MNGFQTVATFSEMFIVDKVGRRILLVISGLGCAFGLGVMAVFSLMDSYDPTISAEYGWLPLVTLLFYIVSFSFGLAPIPWLMVPELTPVSNRTFISGNF